MFDNELYHKWIVAEKHFVACPTKENREVAVRLHTRIEKMREAERKYKTAKELKIW